MSCLPACLPHPAPLLPVDHSVHPPRLFCGTYVSFCLSPSQATGIPAQHILVAVLPGLPTAAELFVLPYQDPTGENKQSTEDLEQVSPPGDIQRP